MSSKIKLTNARLSFPSLFHKSVFNGEEGKFEATFLLDKEEHKDVIKQINDEIASLCANELKGAKLREDKLCMKDGDNIQYDGYEGTFSIKASNNKRPLIIDVDKTPLTEDDGKVYPGCYVNAIVQLWPQDNNYGKRINANLMGVQFYRDGESFGDGGSGATIDDFDEIDQEVVDFV